MKKLLLLLSFVGTLTAANAQSLPDYSGIKLETEADFNEKADEAALKTAIYLQTVALDKTNKEHQIAFSYLSSWMDGTPYVFQTDFVPKVAGQSELIIVLFAAMTEYVLTHKDQKDNYLQVNVNAVRKAIAYVNDPAHKMTATEEFKKAMEAEGKGKLQEYVSSMSGGH